MKSYSSLIFLFLFLFSSQLFAQKKADRRLNRLVKENNVRRIIKTLSADDMMGRNSKKPEEIEKASVFIEQEFTKIGLKTMAGLSNFKQSFTTTKIEKGSIDVLVNGIKLSDNELIVISDSRHIFIDKPSDVFVLDKTMGFWENFQKWNRDTTSKIILVDTFHEKSFKQAQNFYSRSRIVNNIIPKKGSTIYIFGHDKPNTIVANIEQSISVIPMNNVVGIIEGKSKKDEFVVFSGHYDHLGAISPVVGDSIANGADDDASGTTAVIALAKYFKKIKNNERTLVFVAFTAEEIGGFGSKYFSENMNPDKVMAMINIEMIGKPSKWGKNSAFMTGIEKSSLGEIMQKNLVGTPFAINKDPYPEQDLFYRSDNATLARQGVPAHSFSTDQIDSDKLYHSVDDEFESMDISNIVATIKALATATKSIVSGAETPSRVDKTNIR